MNEQQTLSPRQRMQELLAIPDSDRTDAEWDELNELEISLAPGNRVGAPMPGTTVQAPKRRQGKTGVIKGNKSYLGQNGNQPKSTQPRPANGDVPQGNGMKKTGRKFYKRISKPKIAPNTQQG